MNTKPFNLQDALAGKPVVTRDGRKVVSIARLEGGFPYSVVAVLQGNGESALPGSGDVKTFTTTGTFSVVQTESAHDLFMAAEKRTGYINIYPQYDPKAGGITLGQGFKTGTGIFSAEKCADEMALPTRVAVATFEYEV
jgi:hypothetical protein